MIFFMAHSHTASHVTVMTRGDTAVTASAFIMPFLTKRGYSAFHQHKTVTTKPFLALLLTMNMPVAVKAHKLDCHDFYIVTALEKPRLKPAFGIVKVPILLIMPKLRFNAAEWQAGNWVYLIVSM